MANLKRRVHKMFIPLTLSKSFIGAAKTLLRVSLRVLVAPVKLSERVSRINVFRTGRIP
jgi:hypothetical protein